jgi:hypothetical protein
VKNLLDIWVAWVAVEEVFLLSSLLIRKMFEKPWCGGGVGARAGEG